MADVIRQKRDKIVQLADKYGAKNIRIFGSFARGNNNSESDADFLVNMEGSLLRRIHELGEASFCPVRDIRK